MLSLLLWKPTWNGIIEILPGGADVTRPMAAIMTGAWKRGTRYNEAAFVAKLLQDSENKPKISRTIFFAIHVMIVYEIV